VEGRGGVGFGRVEREGGRKKMENEGEKKRPTRKEAQRRWHGHTVPNRWANFFYFFMFFLIFFSNMSAARSVPLGMVTSVPAQIWHERAHRHGQPVPIHWSSFFFFFFFLHQNKTTIWHECAHRHGHPVPIHWSSFFFFFFFFTSKQNNDLARACP